MDRRQFYKGQPVTQAELNAAFDGGERADRDFSVDADLIGVCSGGVVTQHSPTPDLTVDVAALLAYDQQGRRLKIPSTQTVNLTSDSTAVATAVINPGNTKIVSLFVRFKRALSDPRTDLDGAPIDFVQAESCEFVVVQGAETGGVPTPPALLSDGILIADITRSYGQTQILNAAIGVTRKQWQFVLSAGSIAVSAGTPEAAAQGVLTELNNHVTGVSNKHPASAITYAGGPALADASSTTGGGWASVEGAIDQLIGVLVTALDAKSNVGAVAAVGADPVIPAGTLGAALAALKRAANHYAPASGELAAGAVTTQLAAIDVRVTGRSDTTTCTDASINIQPQNVDSYKVPNTLTDHRTLSLDAPTKNGRRVTFTRVNPDVDYNYTIKRAAGADLCVLPFVTAAWVTVVARAGVWELEAWGGAAAPNEASG